MILVDTSIWIDHFRTGELAMGTLTKRQEILRLLADVPQAGSASDAEVMTLIETRRLFGLGIGYVDAHLLAVTLLTEGARLCSRDEQLAAAASDLGLAA